MDVSNRNLEVIKVISVILLLLMTIDLKSPSLDQSEELAISRNSVVVDFKQNKRQIQLTNRKTLLQNEPVILQTPQDTEIIWGEFYELVWQVQNGNSWVLWKNGTSSFDGYVKNNTITIQVTNWQTDNWRPGKYNLTLELSNEAGLSVKNTIWIDIIFKLGDEYANSIVTRHSLWYVDGEKALAAPDGDFASIFSGYGNGYLTLDMGENEEIINLDGPDLKINAQGGNYSVQAGSSLERPLILLGQGQGNQSFDLNVGDLNSSRYIRVECSSEEIIQLDAIVALHFNLCTTDNTTPQIIGPEDFWIWENQSQINLTWKVYDDTPWNYSLSVNKELREFGPWFGSDINFTFSWNSLGDISVSLMLYDVFDNKAEETVTIEIKTVTTAPTESSIDVNLTIITFLLGLLALKPFKNNAKILH
jgi:hypothetical protein